MYSIATAGSISMDGIIDISDQAYGFFLGAWPEKKRYV
jgi:hypothetical protein